MSSSIDVRWQQVLSSRPSGEVKTRLMQGRHPLAVVNLDCPPDEVDVNVHPTKREVRLRHSWRAERLERAIASTLESIPTEPDATGGIPGLQGLASQQQVKSVETYLNPEPTNDPPLPWHRPRDGPQAEHSAPAANPQPPAWAVAAGKQLNLWAVQRKNPQPSSESGRCRPHRWDNPCSPARMTTGRCTPVFSRTRPSPTCWTGNQCSPGDEQPLQGELNDLPHMEPLAQFADSYILVQAGDDLLLIDQHALHERIRYERLRHRGQAWEPKHALPAQP